MKILLLGEYSSIHKNLRDGLRELGHEAYVASYGDTFKGIEQDINLNKLNIRGYYTRRWAGRIGTLFNIKKLVNYDIVQFVNPYFFYRSVWDNRLLINFLIRNNKKSFLLAAGNDHYFLRISKQLLAYSPLYDREKRQYKDNSDFYDSKSAKKWNGQLLNKINGLITVTYSYDKAYEWYPNRKFILMGIDLAQFVPTINAVGSKVRILHGITRAEFKGSEIIIRVLQRLEKEFSNDIEIKIVKRLSLDKFLDEIRKSDIIIDQIYSTFYGYTALYAMALGKVVLSGADPRAMSYLDIPDCPVINIEPNEEDLYKKLEILILSKSEISRIGIASRKYVEKYHCNIKVAQSYIDYWNNNE